jgi:glycosyltransferase involved in cell wall biosynthesis
MKILFINQYCGSNRHSRVCRPFYLGREWVNRGHEVTLVAASHSHLHFAPPQTAGMLTEELIDGVRHLWVKTPSYQGNGKRRFVSMAAFLAQLYWQCHRGPLRQRFDVVIAASTYLLDTLPAALIGRRSGARLIREVRDLWPLTLIELGKTPPSHPFVRLLGWAEEYSYKQADRVVSTLPAAREHMHARGMQSSKWAYIPNGIDISEWEANEAAIPHEHADVIEGFRSEGKFVVGFAGGHGINNALGTVIDAAHMLATKRIAFVLVGDGPEKAAVRQRAIGLGLKNVAFLPPIGRQYVPQLLKRMDGLVMGWNRCSFYRFGISPNKLLDYMMSGRPIVHAVEAANDLVAESGCGYSVPPEDPEAMADAILRLSRLSSAERNGLGQRGKSYVVSKHNYRVLAGHYLTVMQ